MVVKDRAVSREENNVVSEWNRLEMAQQQQFLVRTYVRTHVS